MQVIQLFCCLIVSDLQVCASLYLADKKLRLPKFTAESLCSYPLMTLTKHLMELDALLVCLKNEADDSVDTFTGHTEKWKRPHSPLKDNCLSHTIRKQQLEDGNKKALPESRKMHTQPNMERRSRKECSQLSPDLGRSSLSQTRKVEQYIQTYLIRTYKSQSKDYSLGLPYRI